METLMLPEGWISCLGRILLFVAWLASMGYSREVVKGGIGEMRHTLARFLFFFFFKAVDFKIKASYCV